MLFSHLLCWLKNLRFSTNSSKGFIVSLTRAPEIADPSKELKREILKYICLDINISTKYVYVKKHTHNKNEKAMEIMFCKCNEESMYLHWTELNWISLFQVDINNKIHLLFQLFLMIYSHFRKSEFPENFLLVIFWKHPLRTVLRKDFLKVYPKSCKNAWEWIHV